MKSEDDMISLPNPFPLPKHYPHQLEVALQSGNLTLKQKRIFVSEIASCMLHFKRYPDRDDYLCVAQTILRKYPFFKAKDGNPCVSFIKQTSLSSCKNEFYCRIYW